VTEAFLKKASAKNGFCFYFLFSAFFLLLIAARADLVAGAHMRPLIKFFQQQKA
jgi:hypothetical protein